MKNPLKYLTSEPGIVAQFCRMQERAFDAPIESRMNSELMSFFQRMSGYSVLEVFAGFAGIPDSLERILPRYLIWQIRENRASAQVMELAHKLLVRFMKIEMLPDSKAHGSVRSFVWIERDRIISLGHMPAGEYRRIKSWTGSNVVLDRREPETELDGQQRNQLTITHAKLDGTEFYAWELKAVLRHPTVVAKGFEDTLEMAAERCYRAFYHWFTEHQFIKARAYLPGREIVLAGNEVTSEEFLKSPSRISCTIVPEPQEHDREGTMFVLGWPVTRRQKRTYKIKEVNGQRPNSKGVMILHGGLKLDLEMDYPFYVKCPELHVTAEIMCPKCETLGFVGSLAMKYVHGYGPVCGPCLDHFMDCGELHEAQFD